MTTNRSAAEREQQVLHHIAYRGEATVTDLALALGLSEQGVQIRLTALIAQAKIVSRRETREEAVARVAKQPRTPLASRQVRQKLRYTLAAPELFR